MLRLHLQPDAMANAVLRWQTAGDWSASKRMIDAADRMVAVIAKLHTKLAKESPGETLVCFGTVGLHANKVIGEDRRQRVCDALERERRKISKIIGSDLRLAWRCPNQAVLVDDTDWAFSFAVAREQGELA